MSLPIYQRVAVTDAGDVIPGAEYTVINENTGVAAPIYSDRTGATLLTAPYFADSAGTIQFYIAAGTTYRVAASGGVGTYTDRYIYAAHPQSSATDTTAGSLMAVGAFGLGGFGSGVTITDANTALRTGFYAAPGASGLNYFNAASGQYGVLRVEVRDVFQIMQTNTFNNRTATRYSGDQGATWTDWHEIITADASGNAGVAGAFDALALSTPAAGGKIGFYTDDSFTFNGQDTPQNGMGRVSSTNPMGISGYYGLAFATAATERMRIDQAGNLLVGADTTLGGKINTVTSNGVWGLVIKDVISNNAMAQFLNASGVGVGTIQSTGSSTSYNTSSDYRLKEDDVPMTGATERVKALRPINFAWKADGSRVDGFFAHEVQEVVPEAATGAKDAMMDQEYEVTPAVYEDVITPAVEAVLDEYGMVITEAVEESTKSVLVTKAVMGTRSVPDYQGIDQSKLVPLLTATIQDLIARIEALEGK